ncbi:hypothetical protein Hanom_Chr11g01018811 [Helianthus anomalus]
MFHTLLMCVSNKTTAFNEILLKIQYQGYAIMSKENFNYSHEIFNNLVKIVNKKSFFLFPRFLSFYLQKKFAKDNAHVLIQGNPIQINNLTSKTFTRLSKPSKTQTKVPEQTLAASTAPHAPVVEPTDQGDHSNTTTVVKLTPKTTKTPKKQQIQKPPKPTHKCWCIHMSSSSCIESCLCLIDQGK